MNEPTQFMLSPRELAEALVRYHGIREGIWSLAVEFQLSAINMAPDDDQVLPAAVVPVARVGIHKVDTLNKLSVDAAVVNSAKATNTGQLA